jgi:hypothetical protein
LRGGVINGYIVTVTEAIHKYNGRFVTDYFHEIKVLPLLGYFSDLKFIRH